MFIRLDIDASFLAAATAAATSEVTVPVFGLGISPRRPRMGPRRPTVRIISGVCDGDIEIEESGFYFIDEFGSPDVKCSGLSGPSSAFPSRAKTRIRGSFRTI